MFLKKLSKRKVKKIENLKKNISQDSLDKLIDTNKTFINSFKELMLVFLLRLSIFSTFFLIIFSSIFSAMLDFF